MISQINTPPSLCKDRENLTVRVQATFCPRELAAAAWLAGRDGVDFDVFLKQRFQETIAGFADEAQKRPATTGVAKRPIAALQAKSR
jgi:hypothetical protein